MNEIDAQLIEDSNPREYTYALVADHGPARFVFGWSNMFDMVATSAKAFAGLRPIIYAKGPDGQWRSTWEGQ